MTLSYEELLDAQLKYGTTEEDIRKREDFDKVCENVVIAPWWGIEMFDGHGLEVEKINEKLFNLRADKIEFSFIQVKQIGAPAIIEEILSLGVTKCKNLIFVGSVGSLVENINIGDIVIPKASICGDGASRYLNKDLEDDFGKFESPNEDLTNLVLEYSKDVSSDFGINTHFVSNFSVDTIFAQFPHIDKIKKMGAEVIEMETYTLFKSSRVAGIRTTALLCVSDNTITNKSLYSGRTAEDKIIRHRTRNEIIPKIIINSFIEN